MNVTLSAAPPDSGRLLRRFRLSTYLTLTAACVCLVYAEWDIMPEIGLFAIVTAALVLVAYLVEGKWALSIRAANLVGGLIAAIAGIWAAYLAIRPSTGLMRSIPWPTSMLPFLGPFLMILLPAKLFRPKQIADYWGVHFIGLVCMALACTLADDAVFVVFLGAYVVCGTWSLALFLLHRYQRAIARNGEYWVRLPHVRQVAHWAIPMFGLAAIGFLGTPRSGNTWQLSGDRTRIESGASEDPAIDLNSAGSLELNRDVAFEVYAEYNDGRPKLDLDLNQKWRGPSYRYYFNGRWTSSPPNSTTAGGSRVVATNSSNSNGDDGKLPDLGQDQYFLTYRLRDQQRIHYLAVPMVFPPGTPTVPVIQLRRNDRGSSYSLATDGGLLPINLLGQTLRGPYKQVTRPVEDSTVGSPMPLDQVFDPSLAAAPPVATMPDWTMGILRRLAELRWIPAEAVEERTADDSLHPDQHETIARGLERYLASSGEYRYSLEIRRTRTDVDPVEDFLLYTKAGPCTRFASALAVMLRSVRIPCQVVQGFRGADTRGDGHYDVRQCHAHAWVEVLVPRKEPAPAHGMHGGRLTWHWVTLDPTPGDESREAAAEANIWWNSSVWTSGRLFRDLILDYTPERRDYALQLLWEATTEVWSAFKRRLNGPGAEGLWAWLAAGGGLATLAVATLLWVRRRVRRSAAVRQSSLDSATAFYRRFLTTLARHGWKPAPGQTPLEFAATVSPKLREMDAVAFADRVTTLYYRVRFGDVPLAPDEIREVNDGLSRLTGCIAGN